MVEFALVLPLLITLALGVMDFGKAFNYWIDQTHLANEGARWAVVNRNPGSAAGDTLQQYLRNGADSSELRTNIRVCVDFPDGTSNVGDAVRVRTQIDYSFLPWFMSRLGFPATTPIKASAVMRLEARPTNYSTSDNITPCT